MAGVLNRKSAPKDLNGSFLSSYDGTRAGPSPFVIHAFRPTTSPADDVANNAGVILHSTTPEGREKARVRYELIVDQSNLLPFDFFRTGDRLGRAVVKIQRGDGASGTGFLVAPDVLLTNHHVLPDAGIAAESKAVANYETNPPADPAGASAIVTLAPESLFVTNEELDFTFCGVRGLDYLGTVPLNRNSLSVAPPEYVNIIQHPRGRPKEVALQDNRVVKADNIVVHYSCDTEPGSSGSPVFNNQWRLVALHHASVPADAGPQEGVPKYLNEGIRLSAIAVWLESTHADTHHPEHVARLRTIFGEVDPQIGYFGALGRSGAGKSAAELVIDAYQSRGDELDLGYWNLRTLRPRFREALHDFGRVVAEMGVDLWCLAHADAEQAALLRDHLNERFDLNYRVVVADASPARPLTVLYRAGDGLRVERLADVTAPRTSVSRPCLRAEATSSRGRRSAFTIVPVADGGWPRGEPTTGSIPLLEIPEALAGTTDQLILGDGLHPRAVAVAARSDEALHYAGGEDGSIIWRRGAESPSWHAYVSTNLGSFRRPEPRFSVAHDRQWPRTLRALRAGHPLVMRLPLNVDQREPIIDVDLGGSAPPVPFDPALERLIRDMITPIVTKILAEAKH